MLQRVIPIVTAARLARPRLAPRLSGRPERLQPVLRALEDAVTHALGAAPAGWLRELRLDDDEAFVGIAPNLGHEGLESAEIAFDTLRRLLPDTDIYIGAAEH